MEEKLARTKCNNCKGEAEETDYFFGEDEASQTLYCTDCKIEWTNVYKYDREEE